MTNRADIGQDEAADALAVIEASGRGLADRVIAPCWYHPALGLLTGGLIALAETRIWPLWFAAVAAYSVGCGALMWVNQRRAGVWLRHHLRASAVAGVQVVALTVLVGLACWLEFARGTKGAFLVAGALALAITMTFGRWTDQALRADLRASR